MPYENNGLLEHTKSWPRQSNEVVNNCWIHINCWSNIAAGPKVGPKVGLSQTPADAMMFKKQGKIKNNHKVCTPSHGTAATVKSTLVESTLQNFDETAFLHILRGASSNNV